ncbi:MAG: hypothetical protein KAR73_12895, partial [Spirochaetales bacterium]|nr:hypothetical protein [Spirochaetales bacterium]
MESESVSTKQRRIAELARIHPEVSFTSLAYHIDLRWLHGAYKRTRKDGAVGVDGQTAEEYAKDLGNNLRSLLERAKSGTYVAPPVRRKNIPKGSSGTETRPIGIPTFEDKVLQYRDLSEYCRSSCFSLYDVAIFSRNSTSLLEVSVIQKG